MFTKWEIWYMCAKWESFSKIVINPTRWIVPTFFEQAFCADMFVDDDIVLIFWQPQRIVGECMINFDQI